MIIKFKNDQETPSLHHLKMIVESYLKSKKLFYNVESNGNKILYKCMWWSFFVIPNPFKYFASKGSILFTSSNGYFNVEFRRNFIFVTLLFYILFFLFFVIFFSAIPIRLIWLPIVCLIFFILIIMGISYLSYKNFANSIKKLILNEIKKSKIG